MKSYCLYSSLANALTTIVVGTLVIASRRRGELYKTYLFACLAVFVWSGAYFLWQLSNSPEYSILYCKWLMAGAIAIPIFYFHHLLLLLDQKRDKLLKLSYGLGTIFILVDLCTSGVVAGVRPELDLKYWPVAGWFYVPLLAFFSWLILTKYALVFIAMRQSRGMKKTQLQYVFWGTVIAYSGGATNYPLWFGIPVKPYGNIGVAIYLGLTSYAILKHRLMDITVIVRKTLTYSLVTGVLAAIYLLVVAIFARIFQGWSGYETVFSSALAAGLIAFCFQPLRKRIQTFIDGKFFRQYVDREEKLYELSREVITHTTPEAMGIALQQVLTETFHPKCGALFVRSKDGRGFAPVTQWGLQTPNIIDEVNPLALYFKDHPQPFLQELSGHSGAPQDTRSPDTRGRAA